MLTNRPRHHLYYLLRDIWRLRIYLSVSQFACLLAVFVWLGGVVVSALGMRTRRPQFESRVAPLFHWVATLGKLFTHISSPVSQLQETGVQKGVFGA